jgi:hypothetical protein
MARAGRKQLAVQILDASFARFEEIKQETGLSNAKLIEMMIENYSNTNTTASTSINTQTEYVTKAEVERMIQAALVPHAKPELTPIIERKKEPTQTNDDDLFHILPKTHKVGKPETTMKQYREGALSWMIPEGCCAHYDKNGNPIPFIMTGENGKVFEPDLDELNEMTKYYGKPIEIE